MITTFDNLDFIPVFASKYQFVNAGSHHKVLLAGAGVMNCYTLDIPPI